MRLMSLNELPENINPAKLCHAAPKEGTKLTGQILLEKLSNLPPELREQGKTPVAVCLTFSMDEEGYCDVKGQLGVQLNLTCQRCMQPMVLEVKSDISVSPVVSDASAKKLPARFEPLWAPSGEVLLADWIAEELYLALPLVPRHEGACGIENTTSIN